MPARRFETASSHLSVPCGQDGPKSKDESQEIERRVSPRKRRFQEQREQATEEVLDRVQQQEEELQSLKKSCEIMHQELSQQKENAQRLDIEVLTLKGKRISDAGLIVRNDPSEEIVPRLSTEASDDRDMDRVVEFTAGLTERHLEALGVPLEFVTRLRDLRKYVEIAKCRGRNGSMTEFAELLLREDYKDEYNLWKDAFPLLYGGTVEEVAEEGKKTRRAVLATLRGDVEGEFGGFDD